MYIFSDPQAKKFTRHERWHSAVNRTPYDLLKKHYVVSPLGVRTWTFLAPGLLLQSWCW